MLDELRADLVEHGEWDAVRTSLERVLRRGTSADQQRRTWRKTGDLGAVVRAAVRRTGAQLPADACSETPLKVPTPAARPA